MEICAGRHVWAPNIWAAGTEVYDATIRLGEQQPGGLPVAVARIDAALPMRRRLFGDLASTSPTGGKPAGTDRPRLLGQIALALQTEARQPATTFLQVTDAGTPGLFRIVLEAHDPVLIEACLREAAEILDRAGAEDLPDLAPLVERLTSIADDVCVGPGTMLIVQAAVARGIPWRRLGRDCLVQFGQGVRQRRIWTAVTDRTSSIAEGIAVGKQLTKDVLAAAGVPVPLGRVVSSAAEAWEAAQAVGLPVVVKPADGNHGRGVFLNLTTREEVERAFPVASQEGRRDQAVVVEQCVPGVEHRLLVVGGRMVACAKGEHLFVTGDGRRTIAALIDLQINSDPRRGRSAAMPNKTVELDATVLAQLDQEGVTPETVPAEGRRVLVRQIGTHGLDVTASVHPEMAATAVRAARAVGLDIAGIDLIARDIDRPPREQRAAVCEVNAGPQLMIHAKPSQGPGQPVGEAIVEQLFGVGETGRIPIAAFMGGMGSGAAVVLERWLRAAGHTPGLTCSDGKWVAGWQSSAEPHTTADAARDLLVSPEIDAAVFELDWRSVAVRGLPTDRWDSLVLLPPPATDGPPLPVVEAMIRAVADNGTIVMPDALEPAILHLVTDSSRTIVTVAAAGATATQRKTRWRIAVRDGTVVHEDGGVTTAVASLADLLQMAAAGRPANVDPAAMLAAIAAGISLGLPPAALRRGLLG
jgi:cyanophycin synthetase